jgi:hypothetical protein
MTDVELPYNDPTGLKTGGWSGSSTSHRRAVTESKSGRSVQRGQDVLRLAARNQEYGVTWREVADALNCHHGSASGSLSNLHKKDRLARLTEERGQCKVYVLPEFIGNREIEKYGARYRAHGAPAESWLDGYDQGLIDGRASAPPPDITDLLGQTLQQGIGIGRTEVKDRATAVIKEMQRQMRMNGYVQMTGHHNTCWQEHPGCALKASLNAVARA